GEGNMETTLQGGEETRLTFTVTVEADNKAISLEGPEVTVNDLIVYAHPVLLGRLMADEQWQTVKGIALEELQKGETAVAAAAKAYGTLGIRMDPVQKHYSWGKFCYHDTPAGDVISRRPQKPFEDLAAARKQDDFIVFPKGKLDKKNFDTWKNTFDESPQLKKISDLFSGMLPPKMREYKKYDLSGIILDELLLLRKLARVQVWRIRFALQNNDMATVIDALDCINKSIDRLDKDHIIISHLFSYALLLEKKSAFELLLENGKLEQCELKKQLDILTEKRKQLAAMERAALGGEITLLFDFQDQIWEGKSWLPAIKNFRWFVPQYWYVIRHSCNLFIKSKQKNSYKGDPLLTQHILFDRTRARKNIPKRYTELDTMYLLLETLLKLELEKRKQGFYPATAPEWLPVDPFSGKKFHYIKGKIPVFERIYNPKTRLFDRVRCEAESVAVWSEGCNGKNDDGIGKHEKYGHDDIRAMIRL
ncbi:MAG: hypothetical protein J6T08_01085, partial [Lentisphaeria bacterium]|nr:hypothetical protein [Lentisphaeria bacterium]